MDIVHREPDNRMARLRQRIQTADRLVANRNAHEHPVIAVYRRVAERLAVDRHDAVSLLAGALGNQLLDPRPQRLRPRRKRERQLVPAALRQHAERQAQSNGRVLLDVRLLQGLPTEFESSDQHRCDVETDERRRHEPEVGQGRIASANPGIVEKRADESFVRRAPRQRRVRVSDRDEVRPGVREVAVRKLRPEGGIEHRRLQRAARTCWPR